MWPDTRIQTLFGIELPIIQAPMAGLVLSDMVAAVCEAGGLGSLPAALMNVAQARTEIERIRQRTARPFNLNFFCHDNPADDPQREQGWRQRLAPYYVEAGLDPAAPVPASTRAPFDDAWCELVEDLRPAVVSFHFGLPAERLLTRVRDTGARIVSSATTVAEARWLDERGCDAIIAQGYEAGGHRGMFLSDDIACQVGTFALVPQVVDAVRVPVIATGGISDARGIAAAFALGAAGVQIGSAYLYCPEATAGVAHRQALQQVRDDNSVLTNVFTGRPARSVVNRLVSEVGPMAAESPAFPLAGGAVAPLRAHAGDAPDFTPLWTGQAAALSKHRALGAGALTQALAAEALVRMGR